MSAIAPTLQAFFTDRLATQRQASGRTVAAYRDTLRLLLRFVCARTGKQACQLDFADLDAPTVGAFLTYLEQERANTVRTRNARLAAIHSLFRYAALRHPEHAASIQRVLSIPHKRFERALVCYITKAEAEALLASPDRSTWIGRRDYALLAVAVQTGLRVAELTGLRCSDLSLTHGPHVRCTGKGRKERCIPLTAPTTATLRVWLIERTGAANDPLFPSRRGTPLSTDAVESLVTKYATAAADHCPSLARRKVTPHTLRHSCAMFLREAGIDVATIALWLGHEDLRSVHQYLHADLALKEKALARTSPPETKPGRYHPPDTLLAFLDSI
ncbi:MAG: tyrosine-type recombinase/integrase [Dermatophilaceae bacterium]